MIDPPTFPVFCEEILGEAITPAWITFYKAVEGLPLDDESAALYCQCTGRSAYVPRVHVECTAVIGRRGEKSSTGVKFLLWKALFAGYEKTVRKSWFKRLGRHSERLRIVLIAQDLRVAGDAKRTAEALCLGSPIVSREIAEILSNELVFKNGISLICLPASRASVRGMAVPAALIDEMAWISIDGGNDKELLRSLKPAMIQFAERRLLKMSTPWMRSGVLYEEYSQRASRPDALVWQASTETMTSRISHDELEKERAADSVYFQREFMAEFTTDLEAFIPGPDVAMAIQSWTELPPAPEPFYVAALDASGLTGGDSFTFGIGHTDTGDAGFVVDVLRGWRREPVPLVCDEIASVCKPFRVHSIIADQFAFTFLSELMRQRKIGMEQLTFSARSKPELFFDLKNVLAQGKIQLPNNPEMVRELRAVESTRTTGGNYKISAPRGQHDDYVTVLAILSNKAKRSKRKPFMPEVLDIRIGAPSTPSGWRDPHEGLAPDDPGDERWYRKVN